MTPSGPCQRNIAEAHNHRDFFDDDGDGGVVLVRVAEHQVTLEDWDIAENIRTPPNQWCSIQSPSISLVLGFVLHSVVT